MMQGASVLLFEDMVNDPSEYRYIQRTLDAMDLNYKDDGSAKGMSAATNSRLMRRFTSSLNARKSQ